VHGSTCWIPHGVLTSCDKMSRVRRPTRLRAEREAPIRGRQKPVWSLEETRAIAPGRLSVAPTAVRLT